MPFPRPDLIKLDMRLVQEPFDRESAAVVRAVRAYAQTSGAQILAEGIETEEHERRALSWGATLGQGWHYGRPAPLPGFRSTHAPAAGRLIARAPDPGTLTPVELAERAGATFGVAPKDALLAHSIAIEHRAACDPDPVVVLGTFQSARHFTPATARRYERLARCAAFVGAFGIGMSDAPVAGVRGRSHRQRGARRGMGRRGRGSSPGGRARRPRPGRHRARRRAALRARARRGSRARARRGARAHAAHRPQPASATRPGGRHRGESSTAMSIRERVRRTKYPVRGHSGKHAGPPYRCPAPPGR